MSIRTPTIYQIELADSIAGRIGQKPPRGYKSHRDICEKFIEENKQHARPTSKQIDFACGIAKTFKLKIDREEFYAYEFCKRFLNLFAGTESDVYQGYRRIKVIESYLQEDKEFDHLKNKFDISVEDLAFMKEVIVNYRHDGLLIRWDDQSFVETGEPPAPQPDDEMSAYQRTAQSLDQSDAIFELEYLPDEAKATLLIPN